MTGSELERCQKAMDGFHIKTLEHIKQNYIKDNNSDYILLIIGERGSGKTTFGGASCLLIDPTFSTKNIVYDDISYYKNLRYQKRGKAIHIDEGIDLFFSRDGMTRETKDRIKVLNKVRSKGFFITICIPKLTDVDKSFLKNVRSLVFINDKDKKKRTWYWFDKNQMNKMYGELKSGKYKEDVKYYQRKPKKKKGRLGNFLPFKEFFEAHKDTNVDKDLDIKLKSAERKEKQQNMPVIEQKNHRDELIVNLKIKKGMKTKEIAKITGLTDRRIQMILRKNTKHEAHI